MADRLKISGWLAVTAAVCLFAYWLGFHAGAATSVEQDAENLAAQRLAEDVYREEDARVSTRPWLADPAPTPSAGARRETSGLADPSYESSRSPNAP